MSLSKLFNRIFWHNNTTPAINEDNLNAMSKALDDIDDRVIGLAADILETIPQIQSYLEQADDLVETMELLSENPPYIGANGNWYVWDTQTSSFVDSGIDASITVNIADVTMIAPTDTPYVTNTGTNTDPVFHLFIPRGIGISSITKTSTSGLVDTYTITYSDGYTDTFTVTNGKTAYQSAVEGGYQGTEAQFESDLANFTTYANNAAQSASSASTSAGDAATSAGAANTAASAAGAKALDAEAFGAGTRNGVPVDSSDPAYHNNAPYYAQQAAGQTLEGLSDVDINSSTLAAGDALVYNPQTEKWENGQVDIASKMNTNGSNAADAVAFGNEAAATGYGAFSHGTYLYTSDWHRTQATTETLLQTRSLTNYPIQQYGFKADEQPTQADIELYIDGELPDDYIKDTDDFYFRVTQDGTDIKVYGYRKGSTTYAYWFEKYSTQIKPTASGQASHAEGVETTASGYASHAEGRETIASGGYSHAIGYKSKASGTATCAEGFGNITASGIGAHAGGRTSNGTIVASGSGSFAYGSAQMSNIIASGEGSHAGGTYSEAAGGFSLSFGNKLKTSGECAVALGKGVDTVNGFEAGKNTFIYGGGSKYNNKDSYTSNQQAAFGICFDPVLTDTANTNSISRYGALGYIHGSTYSAKIILGEWSSYLVIIKRYVVGNPPTSAPTMGLYLVGALGLGVNPTITAIASASNVTLTAGTDTTYSNGCPTVTVKGSSSNYVIEYQFIRLS